MWAVQKNCVDIRLTLPVLLVRMWPQNGRQCHFLVISTRIVTWCDLLEFRNGGSSCESSLWNTSHKLSAKYGGVIWLRSLIFHVGIWIYKSSRYHVKMGRSGEIDGWFLNNRSLVILQLRSRASQRSSCASIIRMVNLPGRNSRMHVFKIDTESLLSDFFHDTFLGLTTFGNFFFEDW